MDDFNICSYSSYKKFAFSDSESDSECHTKPAHKKSVKRRKIDRSHPTAPDLDTQGDDNSDDDILEVTVGKGKGTVCRTDLVEQKYQELLAVGSRAFVAPASSDPVDSQEENAKMLLAELQQKELMLLSSGQAVRSLPTESRSPESNREIFALPIIKTAAERKLEAIASRQPEIPEDAGPPSIVIKTRLNGKHTWEWDCQIEDTFLTLRRNFATVYGLKPEQIVSFSFDGATLKPDATLQSVNMEDGDLIDAKVDPSVYSVAICTAETKRAS